MSDVQQQADDPENVDEEEAVRPVRVQIQFTAAKTENLGEIVDALVEEGEDRGLFPEHCIVFDMHEDQVIPGSDLERVLKSYA